MPLSIAPKQIGLVYSIANIPTGVGSLTLPAGTTIEQYRAVVLNQTSTGASTVAFHTPTDATVIFGLDFINKGTQPLTISNIGVITAGATVRYEWTGAAYVTAPVGAASGSVTKTGDAMTGALTITAAGNPFSSVSTNAAGHGVYAEVNGTGAGGGVVAVVKSSGNGGGVVGEVQGAGGGSGIIGNITGNGAGHAILGNILGTGGGYGVVGVGGSNAASGGGYFDTTGAGPAITAQKRIVNNAGGYVFPDGTTQLTAVPSRSSQIITTAGANTITTGVDRVYVNPAAVLATSVLTMPAAPLDADRLKFTFGGAIAAATPVVTTLTVSANAGQTLYQKVTPITAAGGDVLQYTYQTVGTRWVRDF